MEYEQVKFNPEEKRNRFKLLAAPEQTSGAVRIRQDARMFVAVIAPGAALEYTLDAGRSAWVHVIKGTVQTNGQTLDAGDAAGIEEEQHLKLRGLGLDTAEVLLFDLE
jgi:redox-sensitive bicupin YhaK (pirin superfamily)